MSELPTPAGDDNKPELRASDAEREQAVAALRRAVSDGRLDVDELEGRVQSAYTMRTRAELERLIADVSVAPLGTELPATDRLSDSQLAVREGPGGSHWVVSVMSGHQRKGRWRVGKRCNVVNVMGGSDIDLNDAELADRVVELHVYSFWGGGEIRVPEGVDVQVSELAVMGGNDVQLGEAAVAVGGPQIRIRLVSIMAGFSVKRGRKPTREDRRREKELRRGGRRGELGQ